MTAGAPVRVLATATLYGNRAGLLGLRAALAAQSVPVEEFFVVDNSPAPLFSHGEDLCEGADVSAPRVTYQSHPENLGVSGALAEAFLYAQRGGFTHMWSFDQDSVPFAPALARLVDALREDPRASLACCLPLLEPDGAPLHGLVFDRFRFVRPERKGTQDNAVPYACDATITSGTLFELASLRGVPLVEPGLFIDGVDHDMCLRARSAGRRVLVVPGASMRHALGSTEIVRTRIARRVLRLPHYSALRLYYICRNHTWLELRASQGAWKFACLAWRLKFLLWQMELCLHERGPRLAKIVACAWGTFDGLRGRLGLAPPFFRRELR